MTCQSGPRMVCLWTVTKSRQTSSQRRSRCCQSSARCQSRARARGRRMRSQPPVGGGGGGGGEREGGISEMGDVTQEIEDGRWKIGKIQIGVLVFPSVHGVFYELVI